ncbi:arsenical resistance operon transcriptional repressor ArsD [Chitinophaga silvatica]|uniref:Arsenical resistance operon transcriptional repressor ArsD n=1 Tax=Chitinophaga silvatica TaxID=2282649 RepID=A0A3E1YH79_9BACT|nr:arsenic metallochaperone ArsD family protein [Chitinophaga silvatica]RFS26727.1 arsenical resistance operon transcriptional repressor ArsD [Chitinophaga silvatica]
METKVLIFEIGGCCSTSLMNPSQYSDLQLLESYSKELQQFGISLQRINAALKPDLLNQIPGIDDFLQDKTMEIFPITIVDSLIRKSGGYPNLTEILEWTGIDKNVKENSI